MFRIVKKKERTNKLIKVTSAVDRTDSKTKTGGTNELIKFNFNDHEIRTIMINGEPWWVLKDVCEVLDITNVTDTHNRLEDDEKAVLDLIEVSSNGVNQTRKRIIINETGLYSVILRSDKPQAKPFKKWVTREVLPSIRKTGSYSIAPKLPQNYIEALEALVASEKEKEQLKLEKQSLEPKAAYFDRLVDKNLLTNIRDTAKEFEIGQKYFINWLLKHNYLYRDQSGALKPYSPHITNGLFKVKEWANDHKAGIQTLVTPRGRETFRLLLF